MLILMGRKLGIFAQNVRWLFFVAVATGSFRTRPAASQALQAQPTPNDQRPVEGQSAAIVENETTSILAVSTGKPCDLTLAPRTITTLLSSQTVSASAWRGPQDLPNPGTNSRRFVSGLMRDMLLATAAARQ